MAKEEAGSSAALRNEKQKGSNNKGDSKNKVKGNSNGRSRSPSGMTNKK